MNVVIITGYGDRDDYIRLATKRWPKRFGSNPHIVKFGWSGEAASYDKKWRKFSNMIKEFDKVAIIGISAGASVALRAMQTYPDKVTHVITISGPVQLEKMGRNTLREKFPVLLRSLDKLSLEGLPAKRVLTLRAAFDEVANIQAMIIDGATNTQMKIIGHPVSIMWGLFHHAKDIHDFIRQPV